MNSSSQKLELYGIILAAGHSSRMGTPKGLLPHPAGKTVIEHLIEVYRTATLIPYVVTHSETHAMAQNTEARVILGDPSESMIDSLARAILRLPGSPLGAVVQPVDAPLTTAAMLRALTSTNLTQPRVLTHDGQPGHPVWVPRNLFSSILQRPPGGLRTLLEQAESVPWASNAVLADVDTPEERNRWLRGSDS